MQNCLTEISKSTDFDLGIIVTGMHLDPAFGSTVAEVENANLNIIERVVVDMGHSTGAGMAIGIGEMIKGFTRSLESAKPDLLLVLGDRGEMLAGAIAAIHLNIPIVHIHGGERSGTVDEPIRHAISKLAHYHLVATDGSRNRLMRMGERPDHIFIVGAPGLSDINAIKIIPKATLLEEAGFYPAKRTALFLYHPVLNGHDQAGVDVTMMLNALVASGYQTIVLQPNADAGNHIIRNVLAQYADTPDFCIMSHISRDRFLSWMAATDVMVGNSSAGIIEAASFGTPVINVGSRQSFRERNANVVDVDLDATQFAEKIEAVQFGKKLVADNIYGDGQSSPRIVNLLKTLPLGQDVMMKSNVY